MLTPPLIYSVNLVTVSTLRKLPDTICWVPWVGSWITSISMLILNRLCPDNRLLSLHSSISRLVTGNGKKEYKAVHSIGPFGFWGNLVGVAGILKALTMRADNHF